MNEDIHIGSVGWFCEGERRIYRRTKDGHTNGPLLRGKWRKCYVVGETKNAWLVSTLPDQKLSDLKGCIKVSKAAEGRSAVKFNGAEVELAIWVEENRYRIGQRINQVSPEVLVAIATLVGYESAPSAPRPDGSPWLIERSTWEGQLFSAEGVEVDEDGRPVKP